MELINSLSEVIIFIIMGMVIINLIFTLFTSDNTLSGLRDAIVKERIKYYEKKYIGKYVFDMLSENIIRITRVEYDMNYYRLRDSNRSDSTSISRCFIINNPFMEVVNRYEPLEQDVYLVVKLNNKYSWWKRKAWSIVPLYYTQATRNYIHFIDESCRTWKFGKIERRYYVCEDTSFYSYVAAVLITSKVNQPDKQFTVTKKKTTSEI